MARACSTHISQMHARTGWPQITGKLTFRFNRRTVAVGASPSALKQVAVAESDVACGYDW
jgi:hypothetical protein